MFTIWHVAWLAGIATPVILGALCFGSKDDTGTPVDAETAFADEKDRDARVHPFNGRWSQ